MERAATAWPKPRNCMASSETSPPPTKDRAEKPFESSGISLDRLPMLRVITDRLAKGFGDLFRRSTETPTQLTVKEVAGRKMGELLDGFEGKSIVAVFFAPDWDQRVLVALDRSFIFTVVEVLLGGDGSEPPYFDSREFSKVEMGFAHFIFDHAISVLNESFAPVIRSTFRFEHAETEMEFALVGKKPQLAVHVEIQFEALNRHGGISVVIPQAALQSIRQDLAREPVEEPIASDPGWTRLFENQITRAEVNVRAIIEEKHLTLADIAAIRVGGVLPLQATTRSLVRLECNDQLLFWCELGQAEGYYTVRIEEGVDEEQEFINAIASP
jgi:flagellar motor switch protein FliM